MYKRFDLSSFAVLRPAARAKLRAPFPVLEALLGGPLQGPATTCEWIFEREHHPGTLVRIGDFTEVKLPPDAPTRAAAESVTLRLDVDWDVDGPSDIEVERFCRWLSKQVVAEAASLRTRQVLLPAADRKRRELLIQGKPEAEATWEAARWQATEATPERYAWPIPAAGKAT